MKKFMKYPICTLSILILACFTMCLYSSVSLADNPIAQNIYTADPAPLVYGDTMYIYTGHDEDELIKQDNGTQYTMNDWRCYSSKDMVNWTDHGIIASIETFSWAEGSAWAAHCIERDGKFYLYTPIKKKNGGMVIGVAVADSPTGPFKDALGKPLHEDSWYDIDPSGMVDDDGQAYLYFGNTTLKYAKLNDDMISFDTSIGKNGVVTVEKSEEGFGPSGFTEASWLYKRNDLYYMIYASGMPEQIVYSTSDSPEGPWEYRGVIMPSQGGSFTNHPGIIDFQGHSYFVYHNAALPDGSGYHRSVCVEEFTFNEDGTIPQFDMTTEGVEAITTLNPYTRIEAETIAWGNGLETQNSSDEGVYVYDIHSGDNLKVKNVDFGTEGAVNFTACIAANKNSTIQLHLDRIDGPVIGTLSISSDDESEAWKELSTSISGANGIHDLFMVFEGDSQEELFCFDYWKFTEKPVPTPLPNTNTPAPIQPTVSPSISPLPTITTLPNNYTEKIVVPKSKILSIKNVKGKKVKLKIKKSNGIKGYELLYAMNSKFTKLKKQCILKKSSLTLKKMKKGRTYYFKVRAYKIGSSGKKIYSKYSVVRKIKIKK